MELRSFLVQFVDLLGQLLIFAIVVRVVLSWIRMDSANTLVRILFEITEPILAPIRRVIPRLGMFDISPIIAFLLIDFLRALIISFL